MAWHLRTREDLAPDYFEKEHFSIRFFHGGKMNNCWYIGGEVDHVDYCDKDKISMKVIDKMVKVLGHGGIIFYHYKLPTDGVNGALTLLSSEFDLLCMTALVPDVTKHFDIYLEHISNTPIDGPLDYLPCDLLGSASFEFGDRHSQLNISKGIVIKENGTNPAAIACDVSNNGSKDKGKYVAIDDGVQKKTKPRRVPNIGESSGVTNESRPQRKSAKATRNRLLLESSDESGSSDSDFVDDDYPKYVADYDDDVALVDEGIEDFLLESVDAVHQLANERGDANGTAYNGVNAAADQNGKGIDDYGFDFGSEVDVEDPRFQEGNLVDDDGKSVHSSDDENNARRKKYPEFNPEVDEPYFEVGMEFANCIVFRKAITDYQLITGKSLKYKRNARFKLKIYCRARDKGCPWEIYVAAKNSVDTTLVVKILHPVHCCARVFHNKAASADWLAETFLERIQSNPNMPLQSIVDAASNEHVVGVSTMKAYRAKRKAIEMVEGKLTKQYEMLWEYCVEVKRTNPGTNIRVQLEDSKFLRLYMCLGACKKGFTEHCRYIIGLDGAHLKGVYGGQLLTAVGIDANNETWVIAYAVVEAETRDSWTWFLKWLIEDVEVVNQFGFSFISDQQKGLEVALQDVVPNAEVRVCARHLYANFNKLHKGVNLKTLFWRAAKATNVPMFRRAMDMMKALDKDAWDWLVKKPPRLWSKSHFKTYVLCDMLLNNLSESFNSCLVTARDKPIITMLEKIRVFLMVRIQKRLNLMKKWTQPICPNIFEKLQSDKVDAGHFIIHWPGGDEYQANGPNEQYVVNLATKACSCRRWDLSGIPCPHAIAAINFKGGVEVEEYVDECYHTSKYLSCYSNFIRPINGHLMWTPTEYDRILPPAYTRQPGRPRKLRIKEPEERVDKTGKKFLGKKGTPMTCSHCHQAGHNKKTCRRHLPPKEKIKVGRPKGSKTKTKTKTTNEAGPSNTQQTASIAAQSRTNPRTNPMTSETNQHAPTQGSQASNAPPPPSFTASIGKKKRASKTTTGDGRK